jgi:UDP-N-acetylmuramoylalanine--D-glutamate ligase
MRIAILGYGSQGASALEYWDLPENSITVCDENRNLTVPTGTATQLGPDYLQDLEAFELIVRSPSVHPADIVAANPDTPDILERVTSNTNEFMKVCPTANIIGVTGTKGKGTTSSLITRMLENDGFRVHLGGNIGTPPLDMLQDDIQPDDWVVLELANFQLIDLKVSPHMGVCLMVAPEHMDWHATVEEYYRAKQQMFVNQSLDDIAIYYAENPHSKEIASASPGETLPYYEDPGAYVRDGKVVIRGIEICDTSEITLLGEHNWQNICAAITAVWQVTTNLVPIQMTIRSFGGLPYRLEKIEEIDGVSYYNDSFGTTPETAIVAIKALPQPKILILGGSDKGADYTDLAETVVEGNVKTVVAIGITGPAIADALREAGYDHIIEGAETMERIVQQATSLAIEGDAVLLSTACASFDMFKNYQDRGDQFNRAVRSLRANEQ